MPVRSPEIFINVNNLRTPGALPQGERALFGKKEVAFAETEKSKPGRKIAETMVRLKSAGILPADVKIGTRTLLHGGGDPAFAEISRPDGNPWNVTARVMAFDGENVATNSGFSPEQVAQNNQELKVLSGICLFGASAAEGLIAGKDERYQLTDPLTISSLKEPVSEIAIDPRLHPYELDSILRTTGFIREMFGETGVTPTYHIPRIEYHLYGLELHRVGAFSREQLNQWIDIVNTRAAGIHRLLESRRGFNGAVTIETPLAAIEGYIRNTENPTVEEMARTLKEADPIWEKLLRDNEPTNPLDLNYLSYVHAYLNQAGGANLVTVENPEEQRIILEAQRAIEKDTSIIEPGTMVGLYVHPKVLATKGEKRFMYYHPNHDGKGVKGLTEIYRANR